MIGFKCSGCGKNLRVRDGAAGKRGKCPQCGTIVIVPNEELVPLEATTRAPTPPPPPLASAPPRTDAAASPALDTKAEKALPIRWLNFYVYVRIPAGIVLSLPYALVAIAMYADDYTTGVRSLILTLFDVCVSVFLFIGLHRRRLWGWRLNWIVMVLEVLLRPLERAENAIMYFFFLAAGALFWFLPNAIYFKKRRCLFGSRPVPGTRDLIHG